METKRCDMEIWASGRRGSVSTEERGRTNRKPRMGIVFCAKKKERLSRVCSLTFSGLVSGTHAQFAQASFLVSGCPTLYSSHLPLFRFSLLSTRASSFSLSRKSRLLFVPLGNVHSLRAASKCVHFVQPSFIHSLLQNSLTLFSHQDSVHAIRHLRSRVINRAPGARETFIHSSTRKSLQDSDSIGIISTLFRHFS